MATVQDILRTEFVSVSVHDSFSTLLGRLIQTASTHAVVFDAAVYQGVYSHTSLPNTSLTAEDVTVRGVMQPAPVLSPTDDLVTVASRMFESGLTLLPVMDAQFRGVVHLVDVLAQLRQMPELEPALQQRIRQPECLAVMYDTPVTALLQDIRSERIEHVSVLDDGGSVIGFISSFDVVASQYLTSTVGQASATAAGTVLTELPASSFINTREQVTIEEFQSVGEAIGAMVHQGVTSVVVLQDDVPRSIVTAKDLLESIIIVCENPELLENAPIQCSCDQTN